MLDHEKDRKVPFTLGEKMKFYEAKIEEVREIYPDAVIELDLDGQIIIYTGEWAEIEDMLDTRNQEKE